MPVDLHFLCLFHHPSGRNLFDNFDPSSIAQFDEKKLLSLKVNGIPILSQQKLRAIVDNAIQVVKVIIIIRAMHHTYAS